MTKSLLSLAIGAALVSAGPNPIRKVTKLLEDLKAEVEKEGESQKKIFEKVMCQCKKSIPEMELEIQQATSKIGELQSVIQERTGAVEQLKAELGTLGKDLEENGQSLKEAQTVRAKEAKEYQTEAHAAKVNIASMDQAIPALRKGLSGAFLQENQVRSPLLKLVETNAFASESERNMALEVANGKMKDSGEIIGILEQMRANMKENLIESTKQEEDAVATFSKLEKSKKDEISAAEKEKVEKQNRMAAQDGERATAENDLADTKEALSDTQEELAARKKECKNAQATFDADEKARQGELKGIQEAIKILTDDDALRTFDKTMKADEPAPAPAEGEEEVPPAFVQIHAAQKHKVAGRFDKLVNHCKGMIEAMKAEQKTEDEERDKCKSDLADVALDLQDNKNTLANVQQQVEQKKAEVSAVDDEIEQVTGIMKSLAADVEQETANRQAENAEFQQVTSELTQAVQLLKKAADKLKAVYGSKTSLVQSSEDTSEESTSTSQDQRETDDMLGLSFLQVSEEGGQPKSLDRTQKGSGIVMILMNLIKEVEMERENLQIEEQNAQKDYEEFMTEAAKTKKARKDQLTTKSSTIAKQRKELESNEEDAAGAAETLENSKKEEAGLKDNCDFLLKNYETRKENRQGEMENLKQAIAILLGMEDSDTEDVLLQKSEKVRQLMMGGSA